MERYDAIILGIGGIGSAALYHLARGGARVVGIDRFSPPHDQGSSHGHTRVIRQAYFEHPDYVPLLVESYRGWNELEQITNRTLLCQVGLIQAGRADGKVISGVIRAAALHDLSIEQLTAGESNRRWPGLKLSADLVGVFEPAAGYLLVEDCIRAHLDAAQAAGARLMCGVEVESWSAGPGEVCVHCRHGEIKANHLVVTAGAWSGQLLADLGIGLSVRRKSLFWFATEAEEHKVGALPVFLFDLTDGVYYGFPKLDDRGVKLAEHTRGHAIENPLEVKRSVDADERQRLLDFLVRYLPGVTHHVTDHAVCLYTMSPDENFVVDRHPDHANVVFAAGLSGHGFKFAPALGRALAEMVIQGETCLPIDFLSLARLG